ncbi:oligosaccharide flippase family protein [Hyphomonadaceae bacterium BL14]|nr:oligosaccharide flippase family protein [Hyphomonadaceae bacterium BL14]
MERYLNIFLRALTIGIRFLFLIALAKFVEPSEVGYYGLFVASIGYAIYFVGLDFYTYTTREISVNPSIEQGRMIKTQAALSVWLYLIMLPCTIYFLTLTDLPLLLIWYFAPLLMLEHLNQEISRLLIAMSRQLTASVVLFLRQGSWALAAIALMSVSSESRGLLTVMILWSVASAASVLVGCYAVAKLRMNGWRASIDWRWARRGIAVSFGLLLATIAIRGVQTFDRYWLESLGGIEIVGAYVLYIGIASALLSFLDAGVFVFTYPALIRHHRLGEYMQARGVIRNSLIQTTVIVVGFAVTTFAALPILLNWIGNDVYKSNFWLYPWILSATIFNAISFVPHYGLYAFNNDRQIIFSHIAAFGVFIVLTGILSFYFKLFSVLIGLNAAFIVIFIWKTIAYLVIESRRSA